IEMFIEALRPPNSSTIDVVVGEITGLASPRDCNNLQLPLVTVDTLYSFKMDELIDSMSRPDKVPADRFGRIAREVFDRIAIPNKGTGLYRALAFVKF